MTSNYDPHKHHRRSIRLPGWDYRAPGVYFITICTYQRENLFADSRLHQIVETAWQTIPHQPHAHRLNLDEWIVMPNHLHGLLVIHAGEQETAAGDVLPVFPPIAAAKQSAGRAPRLEPGSIGAVIGNFKYRVARRINCLRDTPGGKIWQRGYYERIVRNERELQAIRQYILDNPTRWVQDRDNLDTLLARMQQRL
ncbi:MAG: transposase [Chloroflexi bacterium]|nr:transposase [Chloroflexota bacterium]MCI0646539.1 transposase [Chloroflexota bacterium]MCI0726341.1 transposase [Chloroflexota bacterium]